ncbi:hypothetical protein [Armatimonas sp.]|uniref:hypothetical protein n=1 Tax=Armatimonas sp. TaxID=1872638 RepID=UPI0037537C11
MSKNPFATIIPPLSAFGEWRTAGEDIWNEATVAPWRALFDQLDDLATDLPESEMLLSLADEALAIFAACWRYGSYAHVLTQGAPLPEAIRRNPEAGRITDWEMRRIQIEFSAALAAWWELEDAEPERAHHRARAAWKLLPMPGCQVLPDEAIMQHFAERVRTFRENTAGEPEAERVLTRQWSLRQEANATVAQVYRSGPIESLHAGESRSLSTLPAWPHVRRLYAPDLQRIANWAVHRLMIHLAARRHWRRSGFSILVLHGLRECPEWSVDLETAPVCYAKPVTV